MTYKVKITPLAISQLRETVNYVSEILQVSETALKWLDVIQKEIASLSEMPNRYPLTDKEPWRTRGIRKLPVKGFIVYYLVNEEFRTVSVTAVVYGRRDQISALTQLDN